MKQGPGGRSYAWSYLFYIQSPALLWATHLAALVVFALLTVGLFTRVTSILACMITLSYCHRATGAWFGLDQINAFIAMYLMVGALGGAYSVDRWLAVAAARRRRSRRGSTRTSPSACCNCTCA